MDNIFLQKLRIPCYDTDITQSMKPVSFMNYAQEIANCHATILGFGYDDLIRTRTAWVLSRMHIKFLELPKWRDNVNLRTWHKGPERLFYIRDYRLTDERDEKDLVVATTSWLVVNIDSRRLVRETLLDEESICRNDAITPSCDKIRIPSGIAQELHSSHTVSYSDLDMNGHANNAMYLVWAMDAAGCDVTLHRPLKELKINFNHEARAGQTVDLFLSRDSSGDSLVFWVEGRIRENDGVSSFIMEMTF